MIIKPVNFFMTWRDDFFKKTGGNRVKLNDRDKGFREVSTCDNCANVMRIGTLGLECEVDGLFVATTTVCNQHKYIGDESDEK